MTVYRFLLMSFVLGAFSPIATSPADVIRLKQGGQARGELLQDDTDSSLSIRSLSGTIVTISRADIDFVQRRSLLVENYLSRAQQTPNTVEAHWNLAEWCRQQQLAGQRREQLEQLLDLDPDHEEARRILGYTRHNGRWMTRDDVMTERGYVKHKGRWVTTQELDLIEKNSAQREAEQAWNPKVRMWVGWFVGDHPGRRADAVQELQAIRDPDAVGALARFLSRHTDRNVRELLVQILGNIEGSPAVKLLVDHLLLDADPAVRQAAFGILTPEKYPLALPVLIKALTNESNTVICRAAEVLGQIGEESAVPALIDALVTTHTYKMQVPDTDQMTFVNSNGPRVFSGTMPANIEIMARTGQLPYGVNIVPDPLTPRIMKTITVTSDVKNGTVLEALEKLTGRNLGFNEQDWHLWWAIQKG